MPGVRPLSYYVCELDYASNFLFWFPSTTVSEIVKAKVNLTWSIVIQLNRVISVREVYEKN